MASVPNIQFADPVGSLTRGFQASNIIMESLLAPQMRQAEMQKMELEMQIQQGNLALQQRRMSLLENEHAHQVATQATELEYAHEERLRDMKLDRLRLQNQRIRNDLDRQEMEAREKARLHAKGLQAKITTDIGYGQGAFDQAGAGDAKVLRKATARQRVLDQTRIKASAAEHAPVAKWRTEARRALDSMQLEFDMQPLMGEYYSPTTGKPMDRTLFSGGVVTVGDVREALTSGNRKVAEHVLTQLHEGGYTAAEIKAFLGGKEPVFNDDDDEAPAEQGNVGDFIGGLTFPESTIDTSQRGRSGSRPPNAATRFFTDPQSLKPTGGRPQALRGLGY